MSDAPESPTAPYREVLENWCRAPRLSTLTTLLVAFLREHWGDALNQVNDNLAGLVTVPSTQTGQGRLSSGVRGGILIDKSGHYKPDTAIQRPALLVRRDDFKIQKISLGDLLHFENELTGERNYVRIWGGTVTVRALAQTESMCEDLVMEAAQQLTYFAPGLAEATGLLRFNPLDVKGTRKSEEYKDHFSAEIPLEIVFEENCRVVPQGPLLRTIGFQQEAE